MLLIWTNTLRRYVKIVKCRNRAVGTIHAHMSHAVAGLLANTVGNHFIVMPHRAIEQHQFRAFDAVRQILGHGRTTGDVEHRLAAGSSGEASEPIVSSDSRPISRPSPAVSAPPSRNKATLPGTAKVSTVRPGAISMVLFKANIVRIHMVWIKHIENLVAGKHLEDGCRGE